MRSEARDTRENQKKTIDQLMQARQAELKKKGLTAKEFNKDKVYEHLKAKQRAIMRALAAIDACDARKVHVAEVVEEAAPAPEPAKEKKPKKAAAPAKAAPAKGGKSGK